MRDIKKKKETFVKPMIPGVFPDIAAHPRSLFLYLGYRVTYTSLYVYCMYILD